MKKSLFLLPLLAGLVLVGCGKKDAENGNNNGSNNNNNQQQEEGYIDIDIEEFVTEKGNYGIQTVEVGGTEYYDRQVYYSSDKACLWFYNKWEANLDSGGKATEDTVWAFISNKTAYSKGITKITFTTNSGTGGARVYGTFGNSAFSDAQSTGKLVTVTASAEKEYTIQGDGTSKFFALSTYGDPGYYPKNLQLNSLTIWFE